MKIVQQKNADTNHNIRKPFMQPTNNKRNNGDEKAKKLRYLPKETLMLNLGNHDTAKRCTKY